MSDDVKDFEKIEVVSLKELVPHPDNREIVTEGSEWEEFCRSIRRHGVLTPLLVRDLGADEPFQIVAGERRWTAAVELGLKEVPVVVGELSDEEALELMMVENLQREDIDPVEEARGVRLLIERAGLSADEVGERICKSREWVELRQGLLGLPEEAQELARARSVSLGVLQMVLHLPEPERDRGLQMVLHPSFQEEPLNARQAEQLLEHEIIAPARARKEWEERAGALKMAWTVALREMVPQEDRGEVRVQVMEWGTKVRGQDAENVIPDPIWPANGKTRWVELAVRHGLPVQVFPGRVDHGDEGRDDSVALVDDRLVMEGEKALERNEEGAAWLGAAVDAVRKAAPAPPVDPEARDDEEEAEREEMRLSRETVMSGELSGWVDMKKIRMAVDLMRYPLDQEDDLVVAPLPEWWREEWRHLTEANRVGFREALRWVLEECTGQAE